MAKKKKAAPAGPGRIWVISNVKYPEEKRIEPDPGDLLVFLNKAVTARYYADCPNEKLVFHRADEESYGIPVPGCAERFVFGSNPSIPREFIDGLKAGYDWDYPIEPGKIRCMTTGYMVIKYLQAQYPERPITLVNFGFRIKHSTFRCGWHNWRFEAGELAQFEHVYTAEVNDPVEVVYCSDAKYLPQVEMSAASVLKFNPDAHITVVSAEPLDTRLDNLVADVSKYHFREQVGGHLSNAAYLKLLLTDLLSGLDKVIYLDGDTICRGPLDELAQTEVDYIGICHSHDAGIRQAEQIGVKQYGLTGMMLMNLAALRRIEFGKFGMYAMEHFKFPRTPWYNDETVINCCFSDRLTFLPLRWCYCIDRRYTSYNDQIPENAADILHFIGGNRDKQIQYYNRIIQGGKHA